MFTDYGLNQPLFELIPGGFAATVFAANRNITDNVVDNVVDKRNRQIAKVVKEMGWIEKYGTGIKRVDRKSVV